MQDLIHFRKFIEYPPEGRSAVHEYEGLDGLWWLINDKGAWSGPLKNWMEEHEDFMSQVKSFNTVVCAGGNMGMYPRFYGNYFESVYTWEPEPNNFACLEKNCIGEKYNLVQGGLGTTENRARIRLGRETNAGSHKLTEDKNGEIPLYRLDDLNLEYCDLIHLDVEGFEPRCIEGAIETIKRHKPVVILERANGAQLLLQEGYDEFKKGKMDTIFIYKGGN